MSEHDREQHSSEKKGNKERAERVARIIAEAPWHQEESSSEEEPTGASSSWSREAGPAADSGQEPKWRPRRWQRRQEAREGDWLCPVCGELVFAFRKACIKCVWRERARVLGKGKGKRVSKMVQDSVRRQEDVPGSSQEEARPSEQQGSKPESEDKDEMHPSSEGKDEPDEEGPKKQRKESEEPPDWGGDEYSQESGESEPEFLEDPAEGKGGIDGDDLLCRR